MSPRPTPPERAAGGPPAEPRATLFSRILALGDRYSRSARADTLRGAALLVREAGRHLLRRPVVGICAAGHTDDDRWLLVRRGDTGTWALPGGTLEWGETLRVGLARELLEEAGVLEANIERVVGVYSRPDRDPRFHAVTVVVSARVTPPSRPPVNPVEIEEARLFARSELPSPLAMGMDDYLAAAMRGGPAELE